MIIIILRFLIQILMFIGFTISELQDRSTSF